MDSKKNHIILATNDISSHTLISLMKENNLKIDCSSIEKINLDEDKTNLDEISNRGELIEIIPINCHETKTCTLAEYFSNQTLCGNKVKKKKTFN